MVKRVLMVAFHFPPQRGSSGIQRTVQFVRHLPKSGWEPLVLTAHPRAYEQTAPDQMDAVGGAVVRRAFALDSARHLSIRGRYLGLSALPDRWISWLAGAVPQGLALVRRYRPQAIWSTYPIATAHLVGLALHRLTGLPWVADLRDPMIDAVHPSGRLRRRVTAWVEAQTVKHCAVAVCTTPGAARSYRERYPHLPAERFQVIENGYDEDDFAASAAPDAPCDGPLVLLHSGIVYPVERDPGPLFEALAMLLREGRIGPDSLRVVLRATGHDEHLRAMVARHGVQDVVEIAPPLPYRAALAEMLGAGGLLVLQASNCNDQIPAKLYEYMRAGRPILALTDPAGDTAATLHRAGIDTIGPHDSAPGIAAALLRFIDLARAGAAPLAPDVGRYERRARAADLAALLDAVAEAGPATQAAKSSNAP